MIRSPFEGSARKAERIIHRVFIRYNNNTWASGSGFFVSATKFVTCFHVVFRVTLKKFRDDQLLTAIAGADEHEKLQNYLTGLNPAIRVYLHNGVRVNATLEGFVEEYDVALLSVTVGENSIEVSNLSTDTESRRGDRVFFGGFPEHFSYAADASPFAVHEGMISSIVRTQIGGGMHDYLQIDGINLGGNSGAPLLNSRATKVIGIINGNYNWGSDHVLVQPPGTTTPIIESFRVPLSIAYATQLKTVKDNTTLLNQLG